MGGTFQSVATALDRGVDQGVDVTADAFIDRAPDNGESESLENWDATLNIGAGSAIEAEGMDLAAWCHAKNGKIGAAVTDNVQVGTWRTVEPMSLDPEPLTDVVSEGVPGVLLHNVFSEEEIAELIGGIPDGGEGYMPGKRVAELYRDRRVKARVLAHDHKLAEVLM